VKVVVCVGVDDGDNGDDDDEDDDEGGGGHVGGGSGVEDTFVDSCCNIQG